MPVNREVFIGVDTHSAVHCAAVLDSNGRLLDSVGLRRRQGHTIDPGGPDHALALRSVDEVTEVGARPSHRVHPGEQRDYDPVGLPIASVESHHRLIPTVFAVETGKTGLTCPDPIRAYVPLPVPWGDPTVGISGPGQPVGRGPSRDMSDPAFPLWLRRGCGTRPWWTYGPHACSLQRGFRHPAQPATSRRRSRLCYRALRRSPGRDSHPPAWSSFQDTTRRQRR